MKSIPDSPFLSLSHCHHLSISRHYPGFLRSSPAGLPAFALPPLLAFLSRAARFNLQGPPFIRSLPCSPRKARSLPNCLIKAIVPCVLSVSHSSVHLLCAAGFPVVPPYAPCSTTRPASSLSSEEAGPVLTSVPLHRPLTCLEWENPLLTLSLLQSVAFNSSP